jgi:hypothetical protein
MSQMIRYRNKDKGVSKKLGNLTTESHSLDVDKKSPPRVLMLTNRIAWDTAGLVLTCM